MCHDSRASLTACPSAHTTQTDRSGQSDRDTEKGKVCVQSGFKMRAEREERLMQRNRRQENERADERIEKGTDR